MKVRWQGRVDAFFEDVCARYGLTVQVEWPRWMIAPSTVELVNVDGRVIDASGAA